jgi:hypothetical protein
LTVALGSLDNLDKLLAEGEDRNGVFWLIVDKLAKALEVLEAKAAKERRLRREIEPTTDPVKVVCRVGGSVVGGGTGEIAREGVVIGSRRGRE